MGNSQRLVLVVLCLAVGIGILFWGIAKRVPESQDVSVKPAYDCTVEPAMEPFREELVKFVAGSLRGRPIPRAVVALEIDRQGTVWSAELVKGAEEEPTWDFVRNLMSLHYSPLPDSYRPERFAFCIDTKELL